MTARIKGAWVAFEQDFREDDVESLVKAICHLRGVAAVETEVVDPDDWNARVRVKHEFAEKLKELIRSCFGCPS